MDGPARKFSTKCLNVEWVTKVIAQSNIKINRFVLILRIWLSMILRSYRTELWPSLEVCFFLNAFSRNSNRLHEMNMANASSDNKAHFHFNLHPESWINENDCNVVVIVRSRCFYMYCCYVFRFHFCSLCDGSVAFFVSRILLFIRL